MATHEPAYDLVLQSSGDGWCGTFGLAVKLVVSDILSDGQPFDARITYQDEEGQPQEVTGSIIELRGEQIVLLDDGAVDVEDVRKLEA